MKKILPILIILIFDTFIELKAQIKTVFDQLVYVNAEWKNQLDIDSALLKKPAQHLTEQKLIQLHLLQTEMLLRKRNVTNLSNSLLQKRSVNLDVLHQYAISGKFPKNTLHSNRQPYFIDSENNYCAVGYLMKVSGADQMAKEINQTQNYNYLNDIHHEKLMEWGSKTGLTFDELALIQPAYGGEWPSCIVEMHYTNVGQDTNEYIEVHQSTGGLIGMKFFTDILFFDHTETLYKIVGINEMPFTSDNSSRYYLFPVNEYFADSGKVVLMSGSDTLSVYTYNSSKITLRDNYFSTIRNFTPVENDNLLPGTSLTFCGLYSSTWNTNILPITIGVRNPCTVGAVPVTLVSFDYTALKNSIKLNWQTSSENNSGNFEVQRSSNGIDFTTIGTIRAAGTSNNLKYYTFTDESPTYLNHYRLKQVDIDGISSLSKILFVKLKNAIPFLITQNPVGSSLQVQVNSTPSSIGNFTIYDLLGKVVLRTNAKSGVQNINIMSLPPSKYFVCLQMKDGQFYTLKFEKI